MIIDYLDGEGVTILPHKADAPLVVNPDAEPSSEVTLELFEAVARRAAKILERSCFMKVFQFSPGDLLHIPGEDSGDAAVKDTFGFAAGEFYYHEVIVSCLDKKSK